MLRYTTYLKYIFQGLPTCGMSTITYENPSIPTPPGHDPSSPLQVFVEVKISTYKFKKISSHIKILWFGFKSIKVCLVTDISLDDRRSRSSLGRPTGTPPRVYLSPQTHTNGAGYSNWNEDSQERVVQTLEVGPESRGTGNGFVLLRKTN